MDKKLYVCNKTLMDYLGEMVSPLMTELKLYFFQGDPTPEISYEEVNASDKGIYK